MDTSATDAKNRFGYFCRQAKTEPVVVIKDGEPDTVLLDYGKYQALKAAADTMSFEQRRADFDERYKDWVAKQNEFVEQFGIPLEDLRPW